MSEVEVFEREKMLVATDGLRVCISERVGKSADLCTVATIGTATTESHAGVASTGVADTESPGDKDFYRHSDAVADVADFVECKLASQYYL